MSFTTFSLVTSLLFGAAQVLFGAVVLAYGLRAGRWRRTGTFLLMVLGTWALCSGGAELLVSGVVVSSHLSGVPAPARVNAIRQASDTTLVVVSGALLVPLAAYALWKRFLANVSRPLDAAGHGD